MSNIGPTLAKVAALAGGAFVGAMLVEWFDKFMSHQAHIKLEQSEYDKNRYAQGLAPLTPLPSNEERPQQGEWEA